MGNTFWCVFENLCTDIGKRPNPVGKEIGVASSTIAKWKSGTIPNGDTLIQIADYFDVSVDYLLGRTDNPNLTNSISNTNTTVNGTQANVINNTNNSEPIDEMSSELLKVFKSLPFRDRLDILNSVIEKSKQL